jgi:hypothetical protein
MLSSQFNISIIKTNLNVYRKIIFTVLWFVLFLHKSENNNFITIHNN